MTRRLSTLSLSLLLALTPLLRAEAPPAATPESVGLSSERLQRLHAGMQRYVDEGRVAGLVSYVSRAGRVVHHEAFGKADVEAARPMGKDTIFRIASQTKALTSVAVMMLVAVVLPFSPGADVFGFVPLPHSIVMVILVITALYVELSLVARP